jgi:molybdopterin-guanine dinucleotide biosynthesis protein A
MITREVLFDAVILAGGSGRRLGGVDKGALVVAGLPLLDRVLLASAAARRTVVVGEPRPTVRSVVWAREDPPGGGPLAGLAAGMAELDRVAERDAGRLGGLDRVAERDAGRLGGPDRLGGLGRSAELDADGRGVGAEVGSDGGIVVVLATDLPRLAPDDVVQLLAALTADPRAEAALFSDPQGHLQPLAAAYRIGPIRAALLAVGPAHAKAVKLVLHQLAVVAVPDRGAAGDCDTPDQLAAARAHFDRQG